MTTTQPDKSESKVEQTLQPSLEAVQEPRKPDKPGTKIRIAEQEINLRLTIKNLRHARNEHNFDLAAIDLQDAMKSKAWSLINDPITLLEAIWAFHEPQLVEKGFTEESFCDAIDVEIMPDLRERFMHACAGFFPFVMTLSTMMQGMQPGSQNFQRIAEQVTAALTRNRVEPPTR